MSDDLKRYSWAVHRDGEIGAVWVGRARTFIGAVVAMIGALFRMRRRGAK